MGRPIRIAVIFGGRSGEHEISCRSADSIMAHLDPARYEVVPVGIGRDGSWSLSGGPAEGLGSAIRALGSVDLAFPALHGPYGEDGTIQSLLEYIGVPYVGNGVFSSAAGMDKELTKKLLVAEGLRVTPEVVLRPGTDTVTVEQRRRLGLPVFVKPARAGSSLGVSRVTRWDELPAAVAAARTGDGKVLVEAAVGGREVDVGVLEYPDGRVTAGPPLEIRVTDRAFFDYDAKYHDAGAVFDIPARLDAATTARVQDLAVRAFHALECTGLLRVDFFLPEQGDPVVNEVNTFPGFTAASQFPRMWQAAGLPYGALLDVMVETALRRQVSPGKGLPPPAAVPNGPPGAAVPNGPPGAAVPN
jgi:D-alanine-D-alanine ligase